MATLLVRALQFIKLIYDYLIVLMLNDECTGQLGVGNDEPVGVAKLAEDLTSKRFLQIACGGQHSVGLNGTWPAPPTSFAHRARWALLA